MTTMNFNMQKAMEKYNVQGVSVAIIESGIIKSIDSYGCMKSKSGLDVHKYTIFNACSISKFATAMLVMKLVSNNILFLDLDVNEQLKSWKVPNNEHTHIQKVTLRNLLCHQAGFVDPDGSFHEYKQSQGTPSIVDLLNGKTSYCSKQAEVTYEPFSDFVYSDLGYCLIEQLITDVTGESFKNLIDREVFKPLKMNSSQIIDKPLDDYINFSVGHNKSGNNIEISNTIYPYPAAAGLWCKTRDLAFLFIELMSSLKNQGKLQIPSSLIQEMVTSQGCKPWSGLGVFLDTVETNLEISSLGWGVGYQCMLVGYPNKGSGTIIMTNTDTEIHQLKGFIGEVIASINIL